MERVRGPEIVIGLVLIVAGLAFLLGTAIPGIEQYAVLAVGLVLLLLFLVRREPGLLIAGGIVSGVGAGIVLEAATPARSGAGLFLIGLGGGFLFVWLVGAMLRMPETRIWPLIPGAVLVVVGVSALPGLGLPIALIVLGAALLARGWLRGSWTRW